MVSTIGMNSTLAQEANKKQVQTGLDETIRNRQQGHWLHLQLEQEGRTGIDKREAHMSKLRKEKKEQRLRESRRKIHMSILKQERENTKKTLYQFLQEQEVEADGHHVTSSDHDPYED